MCLQMSVIFRAITRWDNNFDAWCAGDFDYSLIKNNWHLLLPTKHTTVYEDPWITIMAKMVHRRSITTVLSDWIDVHCRAGLQLFRTSLRGLICPLGPRSILSCHNTGSKSGKKTDKIPYSLGFKQHRSLSNKNSLRESVYMFAFLMHVWQILTSQPYLD